MRDETAQKLRAEFTSPPEGAVAPTALVIRPSLWAGVEILERLLLQFAPYAIPILISLVLADAQSDDDRPLFIALMDNFELGIGVLAIAAPILRVAFTRYTFDDEGIRIRSVLLSKSDQRVPWEKITAVRHRRTLLGSLVGIQRLEIVAYGKRGATLHLSGLRNAPELRNLVARHMRKSATIEALGRSD